MSVTGKIVQVIGPVIDIRFDPEHLPSIKNAIQIKPFIGDKNDKTLLYFTIILKGMRVIEDNEEEIEYFKKAIKRANS